MAISFNKESVFNLKPIAPEQVHADIRGLLIPGESVVMAFQTVRDQLVFTEKRIIAVDVQGITGMRRSYATLPYSKIQFFSVQSPGLLEFVADSELFIMFSNGYTAKFEFKGNTDIGRLGRILSEYTLR